MADTTIEWTDAVWNPTTGCDQVSAGCDNCYAKTMAKRLKGMGSPKYQRDGDPRTSGPGFGIAMHPDALTIPLGWRKPRMVFVNSMSDLFHAGVTDEFIARAFAVMADTPHITYQVLTKRHARMRSLLTSHRFWTIVAAHITKTSSGVGVHWLPNVWLGVSVEDQYWADRRIPALLETPAAVRWISAEPLLGAIDLGSWLTGGTEHGDAKVLRGLGLSSGRIGSSPGGPGWIDLEARTDQGEPVERREDVRSMHSASGGAPGSWVFSGSSDGGSRPVLRSGTQACVETSQRRDSGGSYGEPQGRRQDEQRTVESGAGHVLGTTDSRVTRPPAGADEPARNAQCDGSADNGPGPADQGQASKWREAEVHRGGLRDQIPARVQDIPRRSTLAWVIVGGESGPNARPFDLDWARSLRDQCAGAGVPFLFKQVGGRYPKANGRLLDGRTHDGYPTLAVPA